MNKEYQTMLLNRLKSAEGHVRGVERMVEEEEYCIDIIRQVQAIQRALEKINTPHPGAPSGYVRDDGDSGR